MLSTLRSWLGRPARSRATRDPSRRARLVVDVLEDRTVPSGAANTPWPMFGMNAQHTGDSPYVGPQTGAVAYNIDGSIIGPNGLIGANKLINFDGSLKSTYPGYSTPAIADDGTIYTVADSTPGRLIAADPNLPGTYVNDDMQMVGGVKWSIEIGRCQFAPTIGPDGTIYVAALDSYLYAVNPNGTLKWKFKAGQEFESIAALSPDGLTVYAGSDDNNLYAVNAATGALRWKYKASDDVNAAPAVDAAGNVYFTTSNWYGWSVNSSGKLNWKAPLRQGHGSTFAFNYTDPAIDQSNQTVFFGGFDGMYAYSFSGQLKWKYTTGSRVDIHPAIGADGMVYFTAANSMLYAVRPNGTLQWSAANSLGTPFLGADGTLYCGGKAFKDGGVYRPTVQWLQDSPDPVAASGSLLLRARNVSDNGTIAAINYYRDANANNLLEIGIDDLVATNTDGSNFWGVTITAPATPGTYTYFAQAIDNDGNVSNVVTKTNTVASPLVAAKGEAPSPTAALPLTKVDVQPVLAEAIRRWQGTGADVSALANLEVRVGDLGGTTLGLASGNTIWLDDNAAGWGWFVDPTPWDDSEFYLPGDQGEQGRIDLLSVLLHEIGHALGHDHDEEGVMEEALGTGERLALSGIYVDGPEMLFAPPMPGEDELHPGAGRWWR